MRQRRRVVSCLIWLADELHRLDAHVSPPLLPLVVLLGEQCADLQRRGRSTWNIRSRYNDKKEQADRTWDTAMFLSVEAGVEFTDRGRPCFYCGLVALAAPQSSVNSA